MSSELVTSKENTGGVKKKSRQATVSTETKAEEAKLPRRDWRTTTIR